MRSSVVWEESNARPMSGSATFATARFRFETAATRMSATSTSPARGGAPVRALAATVGAGGLARVGFNDARAGQASPHPGEFGNPGQNRRLALNGSVPFASVTFIDVCEFR